MKRHTTIAALALLALVLAGCTGPPAPYEGAPVARTTYVLVDDWRNESDETLDVIVGVGRRDTTEGARAVQRLLAHQAEREVARIPCKPGSDFIHLRVFTVEGREIGWRERDEPRICDTLAEGMTAWSVLVTARFNVALTPRTR